MFATTSRQQPNIEGSVPLYLTAVPTANTKDLPDIVQRPAECAASPEHCHSIHYYDDSPVYVCCVVTPRHLPTI
ncbi:hypothetical protein RR46_00901 [Papilio xuthus]|uniref:Uncharacterized protein n=1 Tax=Papilio xuthus TaxID=66420 RepID=A0A0N1IBB6_PAPXU|nr:hypothetical protein RR46_00901 [Papilio xuthus]